MYNLKQLVDFCIKYGIDLENVTFGFGCKEVYACFSCEDYNKFALTTDDFSMYEAFEEWQGAQEWSPGQWESSIKIY